MLTALPVFRPSETMVVDTLGPVMEVQDKDQMEEEEEEVEEDMEDDEEDEVVSFGLCNKVLVKSQM